MLLQAKEAKNCRQPPEAGRGRERYSPRACGGRMTLPTHLLLTSSLQNYERITGLRHTVHDHLL